MNQTIADEYKKKGKGKARIRFGEEQNNRRSECKYMNGAESGINGPLGSISPTFLKINLGKQNN